MITALDIDKLERFIQDKRSIALEFKWAADQAGDTGDWMFQLGKEVAFKQILKELEQMGGK